MAMPSMQEEGTLVEFRAGRMVLQDGQVHADPRKGTFRVFRASDGLVHVLWLQRDTNHVEEDQIVFPDEAVFEKVQQTKDRVYVLKFNSDNRLLFFWLQEPTADSDETFCRAVNHHINVGQRAEAEEEHDEEELEPVADSDVEPATTPPFGVPVYDRNPNDPVRLAELQRIMLALTQMDEQRGNAGESMFVDQGPSLSEVLKPDNVLPLIENIQLGDRLSAYLPEGNWTPEALAELMQSPQFRQQLDMFTHALRSGQMDLSQFGIDPSQCNFTVVSFLEAIEKQVAEEMSSMSERSKQDVDSMDE